MSAKSQVTITLGRSGRVVKRLAASSEFTHSDYGKSLRAKQPIQERLGNNSASYCSQSPSKRHRRGYNKWNSTNDGMNDHQIGQNDLRFKLMHKRSPRQTNTKSDVRHLHLYEKLSQTAQMPLRCDACRHEMESRTSEFLGQIPPTINADDLLHVSSLRKSYSSWPADEFRQRSPDRLNAYRALSPTRIYCNELHQAPTVRSVDPSRSAHLVAQSLIDAPRPATFASKALVPVEHPKPAMRPPPSNGTSKAPHMVEEPASVSSLLHSLGLGKYAILFQAEEVDMAALKQMGDHDLKELGIPMGPRKKILLAVSLCPRQRYP